MRRCRQKRNRTPPVCRLRSSGLAPRRRAAWSLRLSKGPWPPQPCTTPGSGTSARGTSISCFFRPVNALPTCQECRTSRRRSSGPSGGPLARAEVQWPERRSPRASSRYALRGVKRFSFLGPLGLLRLAMTTALLGSVACTRAAPAAGSARPVERARVSMGSELRLTAWTADEAAAALALDAVFQEFDRLERLMSVWIDGSDIVRLNAAAGEHPVPVSPEVREVLLIAHQVSDWTGGKFDV